MRKAFSVASWNVEHFRGRKGRVEQIVAFLAAQKPDVFALYEVEGKEVFRSVFDSLPRYSFHVTEGKQVQEILVGVKNRLPAFFTQRLEFKTGASFLRPGAFLTVRAYGQLYSLLFLHTKSGADPKGLGLRDDMLLRACRLRKTLDKAAGGPGRANYLFLGDLNTMGMKYPFDRDITPELELQRLDAEAKKVKMRRLSKDAPATWWNGTKSRYKPADLDQVVASDHLAFRQFRGKGQRFDVTVRGWPRLKSAAEQDSWIEQYSDHGLLYFQVNREDP